MFDHARVGGPDPAPASVDRPDPPPDGPDLTAGLSAAQLAALGDEACLALLEELDRRRAKLDATRVAVLSRFAEHRPSPGDCDHHHSEFAAAEVAAATRVSTRTAANQLYEAVMLTQRLPATLAALADGSIDLARARAVVEATATMTGEQAAQVDAAIAAKGPGGSHALFRRALRRIVVAVDPDQSGRRRKVAEAGRDVRIDTDSGDGMARLEASLPAATALAMYATLNVLARALPTSDPRTLAQRRADILADLVLGRRPHSTPPVTVNVTMAASTLAGLDEQGGHLHGYGTITAEHARRLARDATWRRMLHDGPHGALVEIARRRYPSPEQARHVRARNRRCVFPACARPSETCDIDHTAAYRHSGPTVVANLGPLCRHHHRLKEEGGWELAQPTPGRFVWTSPTGRHYTVDPDPHDG